MGSIEFIGRNIPNLISFLRILFIYPYVISFQNADYKTASLIFIFLGISDGLDGILARRFNLRSGAGAILDPLADKLLLVISCYLMWKYGFMPFYLFFVIILRDVLIILFAIISHVIFGNFMISKKNKPLLFGKLNTALLLFTVVCILLNLAWIKIPEQFLTSIFYISFISCFISGFSYLGVFIIKILRKTK